MADDQDDAEDRTFYNVNGQTAGVGSYMRWKDKRWPERQGGTRKKDFLEGYAAALVKFQQVFGYEGDVNDAVSRGLL